MKQDSQLVVACKNPFFTGRKQYNAVESKLLYIAIAHVDPLLGAYNNDTKKAEFMDITISKNTLIKMLNRGYYSKLQSICQQMLKKVVLLKNNPSDEEFEMVTVFTKIKYDNTDGLSFRFNDEMKPYILELRDNFKTIKLSYILSLHSRHAISFCSLAEGYAFSKGFEMSVADLKVFLGVENNKSYARINNFRRKCIDEPLQELNEKLSDILHVEYSAIKTGRAITGFKFKITNWNTPITIKTKNNLGLYAREMIALTRNAPDAKDRFSQKGAVALCEKYADDEIRLAKAIEAVKEWKHGHRERVITAGLITSAVTHTDNWQINNQARRKKFEAQFSDTAVD